MYAAFPAPRRHPAPPSRAHSLIALLVAALISAMCSSAFADGPVPGLLFVWGNDDQGQLTPPPGDDHVAIAAGDWHSLALKADGSIVGWGRDEDGEATPPVGNGFVAVAAGGNHSLALRADGSIFGWGNDLHGQATPPPGSGYVAIAAGTHHSLALRADGSIAAWGRDDLGQASPPSGQGYVAIAAGLSHSLALKADGSIVGWGRDDDGEATPPEGNDFVAIAAGGFHSLALRADGSLAGWGFNAQGRATPPAGNDYVAVAAGTRHSLALRADGGIAAWGNDADGQATPPAGTLYSAIAGGGLHSLAIGPGTWDLSILDPEGQGSTEPGTGVHVYGVGDAPEVEAFPEAGWALDHWRLDGENAGSDNPIAVPSAVKGGNRSLQAVFEETTWTLSILQPAGGSGTLDPPPGEHVFDVGENAQVFIAPHDNYAFEFWLLDGAWFGDGLAVTVPSGEAGQTRALRARLSEVPPDPDPEAWTFHVLAPLGEGATDPGVGAQVVPEGEGNETTEIAAFPADGWRLGHWRVNGQEAGDENPLVLSRFDWGLEPFVQAVFYHESAAWTLDVQPAAGEGATDPAPGLRNYSVGQSAAVTAIPADGWRLAYWLLDGQPAGSANPIAVEPAAKGETVALLPVFVERGEAIFVKHDADGAGDGTSWADAYPLLQSALDAAQEGDEIWVAAGTYLPTSAHGLVGHPTLDEQERLRHFRLKNGVALFGGFDGTESQRDDRDPAANKTVLSGDLQGDDGASAAPHAPERQDNAYHVFFNSRLDGTAVLDGFTVSGGNANRGSLLAPIGRRGSHGGGMNNSVSSPTLANVVFSANSASGTGGGMYNIASSPTLDNCAFVGNAAGAGGAMFNRESAPSLSGCVFEGNAASGGSLIARGGAVANEIASPQFVNCVFAGNAASSWGGAVHNWGAGAQGWMSSPLFVNCVFEGNSAFSGGAVYNREDSEEGSPAFVNSAFVGNSTESSGGAVYNEGSSPSLVNCTLFGNAADDRGGAVSNGFGDSPGIVNAILWGNDAPEGPAIHGGEPEVSHSTVQGGWPGTGNIALDPLFEDEATGNLRLQFDSPAIDAGDTGAVPQGVDTDLDGNPRIFGDGVDMGAYEFQGVDPWNLSVLPPAGEGTTAPGVGLHENPVRENAFASAAPAAGWIFGHWLLDGAFLSSANPVTVPAGVSGDTHELQAVFLPTWTLSILEPVGEGSTTPGAGTHVHAVGTGAEVGALAAPGWGLNHWLLDGQEIEGQEISDWDGVRYRVTVPSGEPGQTKELRPVFGYGLEVSLSKTASPNPVEAGAELEYTISYANSADSGVSVVEVVLRDSIPQGTAYVGGSATEGGEYDEEEDAVVWHLGTLHPGAGGQVSFRVLVDEALSVGGAVANVDYAIAGRTGPFLGIPAHDVGPFAGAAVAVPVPDREPPTAQMTVPQPGRSRVPRDTMISIQISDPGPGGSGVDLATVGIAIDDEQVFDGATTQNGLWTVRHAEGDGAYRFYLFRSEPFLYGQSVAVLVSASDNAGNDMAPQHFAFRTLDRPFGAPLRVNEAPGAARGRPALASAEDGTLFAAWEQGGQVWVARLVPGAREWTGHACVHPSNGGQRNPAVAYSDDDETLFVAWEGYGAWPGIYVVPSYDEGETWYPVPERLDSASEARSPVLAAIGAGGGGGAGRVDAAWKGLGPDGLWTVESAHKESGRDWTLPETVPGSRPLPGGGPPALAAGGATGHLYAVWTQDAEGGAALYASVWNPESGWDGEPREVVATEGVPANPCLIEKGGADSLFLAWAESGTESGVSDVFYATFGAGLPEAPVPGAHVLADEHARQADQVRPAALREPLTTGRKSVFVAWQDGRSWLADDPALHNWDVFMAEKPEGGEFGQDVLVHPSGGDQERPALALRHGEPVVLFAQRQAGGERADVFSVGVVQRGTPSVVSATRAGGGELPAQHETRRPGIAVPPGAVDVDVDISVAEVENPPPPPDGGIGVAWDFSPSGLRFAQPITVDLPVAPEDLAGLRAPFRVYWFNEELGDWDPDFFEGEYLPDEGVIRFFPTHFTVFSAAGSGARRGSGGGGGGCSMSGASAAADVALLLLPHLAALGLAVRRSGRRRPRQGE